MLGKYDMKSVALLVLVAQNSALLIVMKLSRNTDSVMYITSTAVVCAEVVKLLTSLWLTSREAASENTTLLAVLKRDIIEKPVDMAKLMVPAILYTIQNNLGYVAVNNLSVAAVQVLYQLKILTTAIFSILILKRALNSFKWISLFTLVLGIAIVQISNLSDPSKEKEVKNVVETNPLLGVIAVLTACCSSGFAGVYFEKVLKGSQVSIWVRNVQLSLIGMVIALIGVYGNDYDVVSEGGFFLGYNYLVWCTISLQALGGLVVAAVVKYADNLLKGFATSISIVLSCVLSYFIFDFQLNLHFMIGTACVLLSTVMYSFKDFAEFKENVLAAFSGTKSVDYSKVSTTDIEIGSK